MNEFVQKLKNEGNFIDAYLVAKNLLSRDIGNKALFIQYIDLALEIASYDIVFDERKQYIQDASSALTIFSETTDIDYEVLSLIKETKVRISNAYQAIITAESENINKVNSQIQAKNTELLNKLGELYEQIHASESQERFDKLLLNVSEIDEQLQKSLFTSIQESTYNTLTKNYSKIISTKMDELNRKSLLSYNKQAVKCINDVFTAFKIEPSKYKNESNLKALMTSKFFAFDTSILFNETLVFYNHVYSVVFQEVSDAMKYKLTEWALNTVKIEK